MTSLSTQTRLASLLAFTESRKTDCGREGGRFAEGNDCQKEATSAPLDANDPEAVKAFVSQMQKETGLDVHGKPISKEKARPLQPAKQKTLEQERIDAARDWDEEEPEVTRADSVEDMKEYLRLMGHGWAEFVKKAREHSPDIVRKADHAKKKAAKIFQEEGAAGLDRYLEEIGFRCMNPSTQARTASLLVFAEAREIRPIRQRPSMSGQMQLPLSDDCGRQEGGKFASGNQCQADGGGTSLSQRRTAEFLAERRNCGTGAGGFQKGNTCGGAAADVAASAAKGAVSGAAAAAGQTLAYPPAVATGAASGAAVGAVKGLYDASMSPTRAGKAITAVGSTDEKIASLVKGLGGTPKSIATSGDGKSLSLSVRDSSGKETYSVSMTSKAISIAPSKKLLSDKEVSDIKKIAESHAGKPVQVSVDKSPTSTLAKLAKAGFSIGLSAAGALVAGLVVTTAPALAGTAVEVTTGINVEKSLKAIGL